MKHGTTLTRARNQKLNYAHDGFDFDFFWHAGFISFVFVFIVVSCSGPPSFDFAVCCLEWGWEGLGGVVAELATLPPPRAWYRHQAKQVHKEGLTPFKVSEDFLVNLGPKRIIKGQLRIM